MHKFIIILLLGAASLSSAQSMNNEKLETIYRTVSDSIQGSNGRWQFMIDEVPFICLTDETNNRMRIISPIIEFFRLNEEEKDNALVANFHTALDVKYAISDELLWAVFIHPLKELSEKQVVDAVKQVYLARQNFGTTYSSTPLIFGGNSGEAPQEEKKPEEENSDIIPVKVRKT